ITSCAPGRYGANCSSTCTAGVSTCNITTGQATACAAGYYGATCLPMSLVPNGSYVSGSGTTATLVGCPTGA
ncbi:hypothetical protein, partial [Staphylococcus aureus]